TVIHDRGSQLLTDLVQAALQSWGFKSRTIMSRSPWVAGFYEVRHKALTAALRTLCFESTAYQWHLSLPLIQLRLNLQADADTNISPHTVVFGYEARLPGEAALLTTQSELCDRLADDHLSVDVIREHLQEYAKRRQRILDIWAEAWERSRAGYEQRASVSKGISSTQELSVGDKVLVRTVRQAKLDRLWSGPFVISRVL
ncbi:hypothetical protein FOZ62_018456, partial [Perkinsus olseni]